MTNAEKYMDDLIYMATENDMCMGFIAPMVLNPKNISCGYIECSHCHNMVKNFLMEEYQGPETDWSKVAVDTPILVSDTETDGWIRRHFAKCEGGKIYTWSDGRTSFTRTRWGTHYLESWKHAKLAEEKES